MVIGYEAVADGKGAVAARTRSFELKGGVLEIHAGLYAAVNAADTPTVGLDVAVVVIDRSVFGALCGSVGASEAQHPYRIHLIGIGAVVGKAAVVEGRHAVAARVKGGSCDARQVNIGVVNCYFGIIHRGDSGTKPDEVVASFVGLVAFKVDIDSIYGVFAVAFDNDAFKVIFIA